MNKPLIKGINIPVNMLGKFLSITNMAAHQVQSVSRSLVYNSGIKVKNQYSDQKST